MSLAGAAAYARHVITAIVFVRTEVDTVNDVAQAAADIPGVSEVYSVTGELDLIALVRVPNLDDVAAAVTDGIGRIPGVLATETHIAFRTHSRVDLEAAFSIGN
jgi:DNA-binding Lrp family transcriptional regulator